MDRDSLSEIICELYDARPEAKEYLEFWINPDADKELDKYRQKIFKQFFISGSKPRKSPVFKEIKTCIKYFTTLCIDYEKTADLMLYYVEQGCELTRQFGDYDAPFYRAVENNFNKAMKFISEYNLDVELYPRIKRMIDSVDCLGYGFQDNLWEIYREHT